MLEHDVRELPEQVVDAARLAGVRACRGSVSSRARGRRTVRSGRGPAPIHTLVRPHARRGAAAGQIGIVDGADRARRCRRGARAGASRRRCRRPSTCTAGSARLPTMTGCTNSTATWLTRGTASAATRTTWSPPPRTGVRGRRRRPRDPSAIGSAVMQAVLTMFALAARRRCTCPSARPPSFGGTTRCVSTSNPRALSSARVSRSSKMFWNTPPRERHSACRRVTRPPRRPRRSCGRRRDGSRRRSARRHARRARRRDGRDNGRGVDLFAGDPERYSRRARDAARRSLRARSRPGPRTRRAGGLRAAS